MSQSVSQDGPLSTSITTINTALVSTSLSTLPGSLTEFTIFPHLPMELQLKIWEAVPVPYNTPQVHHVTAHLCSLIQQARVPPLADPFHEEQANYPTLPLGHKDLGHPDDWYEREGGRPSVYTSPRKAHALLSTCRVSREVMMGKGKMQFAFGTWVNMSHDTIFLDVRASERVIGSILTYLPKDFPGLAIRDEVLEITEDMEPSGMWDGNGKLTLVCECILGEAEDFEDMVLVEYEIFHGRSFGWTGSDPPVKRCVVAVDRKFVEPVWEERHGELDYYWVKESWFDDEDVEDGNKNEEEGETVTDDGGIAEQEVGNAGDGPTETQVATEETEPAAPLPTLLELIEKHWGIDVGLPDLEDPEERLIFEFRRRFY